MKNILKNQRGETIVEVLVSFVLLLLFTALFVVSLRYARVTAEKAESLRDTAYAYCAGLYPVNNAEPDWQPDKNGLQFDFSTFSVKDVALQQAETKAKVNGEDSAHTFHRYTKTTAGGAG